MANYILDLRGLIQQILTNLASDFVHDIFCFQTKKGET